MRVSKISLFRMVLKRLQLHKFLMVWNERFPSHKLGCGKGGGNSNILAKKVVFLVRVETQKFHHFGPPEKFFGKIHLWPTGKNPSDAHAHKHAKLHHFYKKLCGIALSGNLFNNTNTVSKPQHGHTLCTVYSDTQLRILSIHCRITNNVLQTILTKYC